MSLTATLATTLVPRTNDLQLDDVVIGATEVTATLVATRSEVPCPLCGCLSGRVHSHYQRTLGDLPWSQHRVRLLLTVRKFFCDIEGCARRIFTERLPGVVAPHARRTTRLTDILRLLAFALGGEAGARLVERLGLTASPATLLRLIRQTPVPDATTPRVLGIDDWSFRRGHRYGTILVDLEAHRVLDLLSERQADQFAAWLEQHAGVEVISRDRAQVYADGARRGAPHAIQVADRFHLLKNLGEALERLLLHERPALQAAAGQGSTPAPLNTYGGADRTPAQARAEAASQQRHAPKLAQYAEILRLRTAGAAIKHIAAAVGVSRKTVYRYLQLDGPPERKRPHRSRHLLTPFEPYLQQRWLEGCHTKSLLLQEVRSKGYAHSASTVNRFLKRLDRAQPSPATAAASRSEVPSPRHVASLLVQRAERLTDDDRAYLGRLCVQAPAIATAYALATDFATMLRERRGQQQLNDWLMRAKASGSKELAAYARGLESDYAAVKAGLQEEWSNGQTEGQVNRLKLLKRQMYGRANFDLLRLRVLHAA